MSPAEADLTVRNARVVTESGIMHGGVAATDGMIIRVSADRTLPDGEREIDADGNFLLPGIIDPHVHLGRRDYPYREGLEVDFETETRGAAHGGVTTLLNFLEHEESYLPHFDFFCRVGEQNSYIDFSHHAVISREHHLDEVRELADAGIKSFKMFFNMYKYTDIDIEPADADRVYRLLRMISDMPGALGMFHCENAEVQKEAEREVRQTGANDLAAWAAASPPIAEAMQIDHLGTLTDHLDARTYAVHVSSAEGVDALERHQSRGVQLAGEALVGHLTLTTDDDLGVWGKISPPLRGERSQERLWEGIRTGIIQHVGTDHITTSKEAREQGQGRHGDHMWEVAPGLQPSLEFFLPMMLSEGYNRNRIDMQRLVEVCSTNNAKRFGLYPQKGTIQEGTDADLVIVDTEATTTVDDDFFHGREPRWSPIHGRKLRGLPTHTIIGGEVAVEHGETVAEPGTGSFLSR
ncbi:MAG: dihydroorotase family protein [Salinirussus sp.]